MKICHSVLSPVSPLYYKGFGRSPYPYGCAHPKAPSGRELSAKLTEGECVTMRLLQTQSFADSFRHGYAVPPHPLEDGISEEGFPLVPLYHKSAEKTRVIFRLRRSDIIADAIVILKPCGFSDILFAFLTRVANTTRRKPNITAQQYNSP